MASNRDPAQLREVLVLPMAAFRRDQIPAVIFNEFDNITDFHRHPVWLKEILCHSSATLKHRHLSISREERCGLQGVSGDPFAGEDSPRAKTTSRKRLLLFLSSTTMKLPPA